MTIETLECFVSVMPVFAFSQLLPLGSLPVRKLCSGANNIPVKE